MTRPIEMTIRDIDTQAMREWCEILRDDNPIHLDPAKAEALGFGSRTVNPGPANLAYLLTLIENAAPGMTPISLEAAFLGNVMSGDVAVATGQIDDGKARMELRVTSDGAAERTVLMAEVRLKPIDGTGVD
ncbi:hypothetical protein EKN06_14745 [Croceicoccus ponticola]|uniref:Uncharacterized protein n=1 Tax=Croceicoccus ponticola TaxID=2217664 RepID=A0A437GU61_9SPHN|nr:MaoC/PaaZ C-terminal domain-containing protein [Croceicoccus ponticola]RVQ64852.1 hypothetical protein EKN06_14745 [Croceicoccus ponticola]